MSIAATSSFPPRAASARRRRLRQFGIQVLGTAGLLWALSAGALAAPIATPTPGTATILSPTTPNPTQFNFSPGTVISSSQINSNNYGIEAQIFALIAGLNGCSWIPGATIGSVTATAPLSASLGTCVANTGAGVNLSLALSGVISPANLPTAPSYTGLTVTGPVTTVAAQVAHQALNSPNSAAFVVNNSTGSYNAFRVDVASTGGAIGIGLSSGQNVPMPYDAGGGAIGPQVTEHIERKQLTAAGAGTVGFTFLIPYTAAPNCVASSYGGANTTYVTTITTTSTGVNFAAAGNAQILCVGY